MLTQSSAQQIYSDWNPFGRNIALFGRL